MDEKTIVLMRHAKALGFYECEAGDDFSRPLAQEGFIRARAAAAELKEKLQTVDIVVCSPLLRAKQTAEIVAAAFGLNQISIAEALSDSGDIDAYKELADDISGKYKKVIIVGHNPAISILARALGGRELSMSPGDFEIIKQ